MGTEAVASRISCPIDFDRNGRQSGYCRAPQSRNTSGWGVVEIPIYMVKNGEGPTVLLTGGVHGDEYEGPVALSWLMQTLDPGKVQGRVIVMPAVNIPAIRANTRLSPIDDLDINRCFPGDPRGSFTRMLAHFLDSQILPHADISIDLHTAGHSGDSAPSTNMHRVPDQAILKKTMAAAAAFGAPFNVVFGGVDEGATFTSCVERRGKISLGTELGGWGRVSVEGVRVGRRGVENILKHAGILEGDPETRQRDGRPSTRHMMVRASEAYSFAPTDALFEPQNVVGDEVRAGDVAGYLHFIEDVDVAPRPIRYEMDGILWMSAGPGRVARGDAVAVVMEDYSDDAWG
jgi:predicted deacylase